MSTTNYERYLGLNKRVFKRQIGVKKKTFNKCVKEIEKHFECNPKKGGPEYKLSKEDMVLTMLLYYREYRTYLSLSIEFGVSEPTIQRMTLFVENILIRSETFRLPSKKIFLAMRINDVLIVDATESPIEKPKKNQKMYYSGKKKKHSMKTQIVIRGKGRRVLRTDFAPGSVHDFKLFKENRLMLDPEQGILADSGYQGINETHKKAMIPRKKSKNVPLSEEDKAYNRALSKKGSL